jgi:OOP family OmpA-OmpF porin
MTLITRTLVSAAALVAFATAHAQSTSQTTGPYVGGSIGSTKYRGSDIGGLDTDKTSGGGKIYGGYGITPNVGVELGYADLGKFKSAAGDVKGHGLFLDAVGTIPVSESVSLLGRVGAFNGRLSDTVNGNKSGTNVKAGLGVQWDFNKTTGVRAEWERYKFKGVNENPNADMYSIGLNHHF